MVHTYTHIHAQHPPTYFSDVDGYGERSRRRIEQQDRTAWAAFGPLREAMDYLTNSKLRAHLFDKSVLPAFCYAAETWADTVTTFRRLWTTHRALKKFLLKSNRQTQYESGLKVLISGKCLVFVIQWDTWHKRNIDGPVIS